MRPMASTSMSMTARSTATSSASAKNSRPSTRNSRRSKRSMASVIDTANAEAPPTQSPQPQSRPPGASGTDAEWSSDDNSRNAARIDARATPARRRRLHWPSVSPLTRRIVAVNVLPLALLAVGFLYLGKFEATLIGQQIESLHTQGEIFAAALSEGAVLDSADEGEVLLPDLARQMMRRLVEPTQTRARLFDTHGRLIADSRLLGGPGGSVQVAELPPAEYKDPLM